ncbi:MAG: CCC motif membrane protein [Bacteroidota bacterium]|nr:CCC motif membrane protein [Ferruginibacter sp.]
MEHPDLLNPTNYNAQQNLPNATTVLVLGIISIVGSFCYGIVGLVCGIVGLILANRDKKLYLETPDLYSPSSFSTSSAGRVCSIIGIVLSCLVIVIMVVYIAIIGSMIYSNGLK